MIKRDDNTLIIAGKRNKARHTQDPLLIDSENVYFTSSGVFKLKGKILAMDISCKVSYEDIVTAIMRNHDVVIGLQFDDSIWVAVIIPLPLEQQLEIAVENEDYMLAHQLKQQIDNDKRRED